MKPEGILFMAATVSYRKVECKSLLNKSSIEDYAVNCYTGCSHGCVYCYARFVTRFTHPHEPWGGFVDIKENAVQVLAKEVKRRRVGNVMLSSVCDAWQPVESKALLTRQCIELLVQHRFPIRSLTKSALAARDLDLLKLGDVEFGATITTLDPNLAKLFEPGASPPQARLELLQTAKSKGLKTYAFLGPLVPFLSDTERNITGLLKAVKEIGVDYFYIDKLNMRYGVWQDLLKLLKEHYPTLIPEYRKIFFDEATKTAYADKLSESALTLAGKFGMADKMQLCM